MSDKSIARGVARDRCRSHLYPWMALVIASVGAAPGLAQESPRSVEFNIAAQLLESALVEFGAQARVQVAAADADVSGIKTAGVTGKRAVEEALAQLLRGTGLEYRKINERTYGVSRSGRSASGEVSRPLLKPLSGDERGGADPGSAQLPVAPVPDRSSAESHRDGTRARAPSALEEVLVTGSHLRGELPAGATLITLDRVAIADTGLATVHEVLRTLPQNFGGGPSEDTRSGKEAGANGVRSTALNLRGLGAGATLVLINGRRLAAGGVDGSFTDISSIPLTAIERIDVLPDGASAIYGSEAVGGVVNIILRKDFSGAETQARYGAVSDGGMNERQFSQAFGSNWSTGHALITYEYLDRDALPASEREQSAQSDLRAFGGDNFGTNQSNPGTILIGTQTWAIPAGQDGTSLTPSSFVAGTVNLSNLNEGRDLLAAHQRHSAFVSANQSLSHAVALFAEGLFTTREVDGNNSGAPATLTVPVTNAYYVNPANGMGPIRVAYNFFDDLGPRTLDAEVDTYNAALGATFEAPRDWRILAYGGYARENVGQLQDAINGPALTAALADPNRATAFNPFADGSGTNPATLATLRAQTLFDSESELESANLTADGRLMSLPGGDARLAVGVDYRNELFESLSQTLTTTTSAQFKRNVFAAFTELSVPLFGARNARAGLHELRLSLAGRWEDYSDFGPTAVPKIGLTWAPASSFALRGTWSESYKAPNLADLDETGTANFIFAMQDPLAPSGISQVLVRQGNNADLQEETATTWTVGAELSPVGMPDLRFDVSYFEVDFRDRIENVSLTQTLLRDPDIAARVTRNPSAELRDEVCSRGRFVGANPDDCRNLPIAAIVDVRDNNTAILKTSGADFRANYRVTSRAGDFDFGLNASRIFEFARAQVQSAPLVELAGDANQPLKLRLRGLLGWRAGGITSSAFINYADGAIDRVSTPNRNVGSWSTLDLQVGYEWDGASGPLVRDTKIALSVQNAFDEDPPFVNDPAGVGYDRENADLLGRFMSLTLRKQW